jgi:hypothetical protein
MVQTPGHAPVIGTEFRSASGKLDAGGIEMGDTSERIRGIDRRRDRIDHFTEAGFAFLQRSVRGAQLFMVTLRRQVGYEHADGGAAIARQSVEGQVRGHDFLVGADQARFAASQARLALADQFLEGLRIFRRDEIPEARTN